MTDCHCHVRRGSGRVFLCDPASGETRPGDRRFVGVHPWNVPDGEAAAAAALAALRRALAADGSVGVGEIGLDRLRAREIPAAGRGLFDAQLALAAEFGRPVVLHGAKCWGEVVSACLPHAGRIPSFLFHGFSRSMGLMPAIVRLNGFVSVGPAVLNGHAVNYRAFVRALPEDRILVESDATAETAAEMPSVEEIARETAALRGVAPEAFAATLERNADAFAEGGR